MPRCPPDSPRPARAALAPQTTATMSIFIGNLSYDADDSAISQYVSGVAQVTSAQVMRYQNGDSKGYAIVQMASQQDADNAIQQLNRSMFMDQELTCGCSPTRSRRRGRS